MIPWDLGDPPTARLRSRGAPERPWPKLVSRPAVPMPVAGTQRADAPLATGTEWTVPLLERFDAALSKHARRLQIDTYPIQYEVITAAQMIDLCSTIGMPVHYPHWSFGKQLRSDRSAPTRRELQFSRH